MDKMNQYGLIKTTYTFNYVHDMVTPELAPDPPAIAPAIELYRRVTRGLRVMSVHHAVLSVLVDREVDATHVLPAGRMSTTEFRNIGHLFGVHKSTVHVTYHKFVGWVSVTELSYVRQATFFSTASEEPSVAAYQARGKGAFAGPGGCGSCFSHWTAEQVCDVSRQWVRRHDDGVHKWGLQPTVRDPLIPGSNIVHVMWCTLQTSKQVREVRK